MVEVRLRLVTVDDAHALTELAVSNREHLAPWDAQREESWFTLETQRAVLETALEEHLQGRKLPLAITVDDHVVGRLDLNGITRGAFQSAAVGYWVDAQHTGQGVATEAVRQAKTHAFGELGLHRLQAETVPYNVASQRVLAHNGFELYGRAPAYLRLAGTWQECLLFQVIAPTADG